MNPVQSPAFLVGLGFARCRSCSLGFALVEGRATPYRVERGLAALCSVAVHWVLGRCTVETLVAVAVVVGVAVAVVAGALVAAAAGVLVAVKDPLLLECS